MVISSTKSLKLNANVGCVWFFHRRLTCQMWYRVGRSMGIPFVNGEWLNNFCRSQHWRPRHRLQNYLMPVVALFYWTFGVFSSVPLFLDVSYIEIFFRSQMRVVTSLTNIAFFGRTLCIWAVIFIRDIVSERKRQFPFTGCFARLALPSACTSMLVDCRFLSAAPWLLSVCYRSIIVSQQLHQI